MRIRYWLREGLKITGTILVACIFYTTLMAMMETDFKFTDSFTLAGTYMVLFGAGLGMALSTALYSLHFPLVISFGSTRKEVLLGLHCYRLLSTVLQVTISTILLTIGGDIALSPGSLILVCTGLFLLFHAFGSVLGILYVKLGKAALIAFSIIFTLLLVSGFVATVFILRGGAQLPAYLPWIVLGVGTLFYALISIPESRTIKSYNVKL